MFVLHRCFDTTLPERRVRIMFVSCAALAKDLHAFGHLQFFFLDSRAGEWDINRDYAHPTSDLLDYLA